MKNSFRAFRKTAITHLIIAGGMTEYCVDTTCRRAASLGYAVTLAGDAHLTRDNGALTAAQIITHHNFMLDLRTHGTRLLQPYARWTAGILHTTP